MQRAKQTTKSSNKAVVTAENRARQKPRSAKRQAAVVSAKSRLQQARADEVRTEMLHYTIGQFNNDAFETFTTSVLQRISEMSNEK